MQYHYTTNGDSNQQAKPTPKTFYIIGALMFLGGLATLILNFMETEPVKTGKWIVNAITTLGGLAFIFSANKFSKPQNAASIVSVHMDENKIKVLSEYGAKCEELSYKELSKIDFRSDAIYLYSKTSSQIKINLSLINPEEKQTELRSVLTQIQKRYELQS